VKTIFHRGEELPHAEPGPHWLDAQLNVYNIDRMLARPPEHYEFLRVDPNNNCNVHCVYCHNHRSQQVLSSDDVRRLLHTIRALRNFQMGCVMEPTLDERLADLRLDVRACPVGPTEELILQTNGILLHRHDTGKLREARMTRLAVSIDSADPAVHRLLRGGTGLGKVERNVRAFRQSCPATEVHFITTVTRANIDTLEGLVRFGLDLGVSRFALREVFYYPDSNVVDHARMPDLVLRPGDYERMAARLTDLFGEQATFEFADGARLARLGAKMVADSRRNDDRV
jgi:MoaA/NifB/PqqE/SkfB family radical SAM enzyme